MGTSFICFEKKAVILDIIYVIMKDQISTDAAIRTVVRDVGQAGEGATGSAGSRSSTGGYETGTGAAAGGAVKTR